MSFVPDDLQAVPEKLAAMLESAGQSPLTPGQSELFAKYLDVLMRWNARTNLTAIRDQEGILRRHFLECIACARALPSGINTLLDFGSGGGFPGIPVAICRPEIAVSLAESQGKKAAFLREAVRTLGLSIQVHGNRAESLGQKFACLTLRAVDQMSAAIEAASALVEPGGWLAVMTTPGGMEETRAAAGEGFTWKDPVVLPGSDQRILWLGQGSQAI